MVRGSSWSREIVEANCRLIGVEVSICHVSPRGDKVGGCDDVIENLSVAILLVRPTLICRQKQGEVGRGRVDQASQAGLDHLCWLLWRASLCVHRLR